ncbi:MAG: pyruvate kinase [Microscillaceae bacterium]|jgi:pyruvate kinase|nr:pyruvate kinase [Microscillaceae bacterium]
MLNQEPIKQEESEKIRLLIYQIQLIIRQSTQLREKFKAKLSLINPMYRNSAHNLIDYISLRQFDIRELQKNLSELGLSSLGRCESHVRDSLQKVLKILHLIQDTEILQCDDNLLTSTQSKLLLENFTENLLGKTPETREVRIMVTLPDEAAENPELVRSMFLAGMNVARINCSHGSPEVWQKMIQHLRQVTHNLGKKCAIMMDLGGPKLRTGYLARAQSILKVSPRKNESGIITSPARLALASTDQLIQEHDLPVVKCEAADLARVNVGDKIHFTDLQHKKRVLKIKEKTAEGFIGELNKTTYLAQSTELILKKKKSKNLIIKPLEIFAKPLPIILRVGDVLRLQKSAILGKNAQTDEQGNVVYPAEIACQMPEIFDFAKSGEIVRFDDGKIEGIIQKVDTEYLDITITLAEENGSKLSFEKAINFPQTNFLMTALTAKDREDLEFVVQNADMVALSFVHQAQDINQLIQAIQARSVSPPGIVVKIETQQAFQNLPDILLAAMQHTSPIGVMIARGDLAVEIGWVRLAEVQEEILWVCEAAHIPVIWATQVLENLAKKGVPSRAEITDAAMSQRAECVMLNKGPFILKAIKTLNDILNAMQAHQRKKTAKLRRLSVSTLQNNEENALLKKQK